MSTSAQANETVEECVGAGMSMSVSMGVGTDVTAGTGMVVDLSASSVVDASTSRETGMGMNAMRIIPSGSVPVQMWKMV